MAIGMSGVVSIAFVVITFIASALPETGRAADKVTFGLPLDASFSYMFVAEEKGYFSDEGIDITFLPASGSVANAGLIGGSIQYSAAVSTAENAIMRGAPLKVITEKRFPSLPREDVALAVNDLIDSATVDGTISSEAIKRDVVVHSVVLEMPLSALPPPEKIYDFSLIKAVDKELAASGWTASN